MKKSAVIMAMLIMVMISASTTTSIFAQLPKSQERQIQDIDNRVSKLDREIISLRHKIGTAKAEQWDKLNYQLSSVEVESTKIDALDSTYQTYKDIMSDSLWNIYAPVSKALSDLELQNPRLFEKLKDKISERSDLEASGVRIFKNYANYEGVPLEVKKRELKLRINSLYLRRQEMVLKKTSQNLDRLRSDSVNGLKVILKNNYFQQINFKIVGLDGGENVPCLLGPGQEQIVYLIPGSYVVRFFLGDRELAPISVPVDGTIKYYLGRPCYGYAAVLNP